MHTELVQWTCQDNQSNYIIHLGLMHTERSSTDMRQCDIASGNSLWETILFHMSSHVHYISCRKSLTIFYGAISVQIQNWLIADLQRSLITVLRMELQGESEIPVSNNLLGNTVDRRLLPSETAAHDRRLLECKIWYDSCLMSSDALQSKYLPSYHSLYCFTQSGYDIQIFEKARSMDKTRAEIEQKGKRKLVANVQWVSSLLSLFISTLNNRVRHLIPFENQEIQKNFLLVKFQQKRGVVSKR